MKVLFYLNQSIIENNPKGGPYGVGAFYYNEMLKRNEKRFSFLNDDIGEIKISKSKKIIRKLPNWINCIQRELRKRQIVVNFLENEPQKSNIDFSDYDIVFFHQPIDLYNEKINLETYKGIVLLQSHCPEPQSHEICAKFKAYTRYTIPNLIKRYEKIDEYAFTRADYIVFPCEEAEEPYVNKWPFFDIIKRTKKQQFRYILTGINPAVPQRNRYDVLKELNIPQNAFIASYVGRHNKVKGFDLLKNIASACLGEYENVFFISAGKEEPLKRLDHPRWKEIGWTTDAYSYIAASDVFILPNRETYFDLVMLEILSLGKIVIASRTGGNKFFEHHHVKGVFLYDNINEAVKLFEKIRSLSKQEREVLEKANMEFFNCYCRVESMYNNCIEVLNEIMENNE